MLGLGTLLLLVPVGLLLYAVVRRALNRSPPGPIGVPGMGLLPWIFWRTATNPQHRLFTLMQELRSKYGDLLSYKMGTQEFVLISGYETLREAFVNSPAADWFICRANTNLHKLLFSEAGIAGSEGALWQEHRRFALRVLKDFGFGRNISELQIEEEAARVVAFLRQKDGQKVDVKNFVTKSVANVISRFIFSDFCSYEDRDSDEFISRLGIITNQNIVGLLAVCYRELPLEAAMKLAPANREQFKTIKWLEEFGGRRLESIRSKYRVTEVPSNYIESYLQEQQKRGEDVGTFTDFQLVRTILELYAAGVDTTSNSLRWCLLYAALNPELQDRCHAEIMANIGRRPVTMKDKKDLHYCQAFLDEAQRISTLVPMSVDHRACKDTEFKGYNISSNAIILVNLYGLHHDEKLFPEPHKFDPNRFLTSDGQYKSSDFLSQFGIGKRSCLGEVLARMEMFLFFVTYMQHFRFLPDSWSPQQQEQILLGTEGLVHAPLDHKLIVSNRDDAHE